MRHGLRSVDACHDTEGSGYGADLGHGIDDAGYVRGVAECEDARFACPQMRFDRGWTERFAGIVIDPVDLTEAHPGHDVGVMLAGRDQDGLLFPAPQTPGDHVQRLGGIADEDDLTGWGTDELAHAATGVFVRLARLLGE